MAHVDSVQDPDQTKKTYTVGFDQKVRDAVSRRVGTYRLMIPTLKSDEEKAVCNGVAIAIRLLLADPNGFMYHATLQMALTTRMRPRPSRDLQLAILREAQKALDFARSEVAARKA